MKFRIEELVIPVFKVCHKIPSILSPSFVRLINGRPYKFVTMTGTIWQN
jgi:hypothetical protein